ncbi:YchF/TatD family DNA exonuclease [Sodalis sp. CWE]|uniref:YchF/TatD family DNA exonuclease n=1 Tax=Sodalis sp. CWE TaxID=2803816 RepID=UPI001C7D493B|nr:YchF/TatD family DNA exonuclease [Sodalis sp. CWE]MBX4181050.1 YchF/TatD family DNA exonuclease [Sodalis sp. CWE]
MFLVDSHCHLDSLNYQMLHRDVTDVIDKAKLQDVKIILTVCTTISNFHFMREMIGTRKGVLFSCGTHPLNLDESYSFFDLYNFAMMEDVIAIGETGLDYFRRQDNKEKQRMAFREHIRVGRMLNKPLIVHMRNAHKDILIILSEERAYECGGVLHSFAEDRETARKLLDEGFSISFSGMVTFRNAKELHEVVRYIPFDRLLIETDSPYLTPAPYRGKENQPAYVRNIAECIATIKGCSLAWLANSTTNNFGRLFHVNINSYLKTD